MTRFELVPDLARDPSLAPVVRGTEPAIAAALGADAARTAAEWGYRPDDYGRRELVLRLWSADRQAEEVFQPSDLGGNGAFKEAVGRMKDALAHNAEWRRAVHDFMARAEEWSRNLPGAAVERGTVVLYEQRSGKYELPSLVVRSGGSTMRVVPAAGWVMTPRGAEEIPGVGKTWALGRVDLNGSGGPIWLYYVRPTADDSPGLWVYPEQSPRPNPRGRWYHPLTPDVFSILAQTCLHG